MDKWDYIKLKSFCTTKEMVSNWRDHPQSLVKKLNSPQNQWTN
jgi:hypothetical protein